MAEVSEGRVVFVTRYETRVHARNVHAGYGKRVVIYADSRQQAVNEAVATGWGGRPSDARVTIDKVVQEPVVIPPATTTHPSASAGLAGNEGDAR